MRETLRTAGICFGCLALFEVAKRLLSVTISHVTAGSQILASDLNTVIDQVNTSASNATTDESNISTLQSQMSTANSNISTLQSQVSTLQGSPTFSGVISTQGINLAHGSLFRTQMIGDTTIAHGSGGTSVGHSLGTTPNVIIPILDAGSPTGPVSIFINYGTAGGSSFTAYTSGTIDTGNVRFFVASV